MVFPAPNVTDVIGLFTNANTVTSNQFWNYLMIVLFVIFFLLLKSFTAERAVVVAAFICAITSYLLAVSGLVNPIFIVVFTLAIALGLLFT